MRATSVQSLQIEDKLRVHTENHDDETFIVVHVATSIVQTVKLRVSGLWFSYAIV